MGVSLWKVPPLLAEAQVAVASPVESGGSNAIDAGPLGRARELEGPDFLGMTLERPPDLDFGSAWKPIG